jgi:hypothetical protein
MKVVSAPRRQRSALENFARWFHQDFFVIFPEIHVGGAAYLSQLSRAQRRSLREELAAFLARHEGGSEKALRRARFKLGADAWPPRCSTRAELLTFMTGLGER